MGGGKKERGDKNDFNFRAQAVGPEMGKTGGSERLGGGQRSREMGLNHTG
jgi:hypothetical protein